jgi:hypothetical protein
MRVQGGVMLEHKQGGLIEGLIEGLSEWLKHQSTL